MGAVTNRLRNEQPGSRALRRMAWAGVFPVRPSAGLEPLSRLLDLCMLVLPSRLGGRLAP